MVKMFEVKCKACGEARDYAVGDIAGMAGYIEDVAEDARDEAEEWPREFDEAPEVGFVRRGGETFFELAAALRRGDIAEAELLLDRVAEGFGEQASTQVQLGRYSRQAQAA